MKDLKDYIVEVSGWKLDDEDWTWVNDENDGKDLYAVRLWTGSGYLLDAYAAYANSENEALCYTVIWLEENDAKTKCFADKSALTELKKLDIEPEQAWLGTDNEDFDETYQVVDATKDSEMLDEYECKLTHFAKNIHFVLKENLKVQKFPKNKIPKK